MLVGEYQVQESAHLDWINGAGQILWWVVLVKKHMLKNSQSLLHQSVITGAIVQSLYGGVTPSGPELPLSGLFGDQCRHP